MVVPVAHRGQPEGPDRRLMTAAGQLSISGMPPGRFSPRTDTFRPRCARLAAGRLCFDRLRHEMAPGVIPFGVTGRPVRGPRPVTERCGDTHGFAVSVSWDLPSSASPACVRPFKNNGTGSGAKGLLLPSSLQTICHPTAVAGRLHGKGCLPTPFLCTSALEPDTMGMGLSLDCWPIPKDEPLYRVRWSQLVRSSTAITVGLSWRLFASALIR